MLSIAALVTRNPVSVIDHSTLVAFLSMFGLATGVVATAGRLPARLAGWSCGLGAVVAYIGYLMGQTSAPWVYAAVAALAAVTFLTIVVGRRRTRGRGASARSGP